LTSNDQLEANGTVDTKTLAAGLRKANIAVAHADALTREMTEYAERHQIQGENQARLDAVRMPRIELPELNPPVDLGELNDLAAYFTEEAT